MDTQHQRSLAMIPTRSNSKRLTRRFFRRDAITVAKELLGKRLVRIFNGQRLAGMIVETEAYLGVEDRAAHSFAGRRTARTETMYADGGTAYVFLNYGIHHLLNVVTETVGVPSAVLLRAIEPVEGIETMQVHRPTARSRTEIGSGPGKLGAAFAIDRTLDGEDLVSSEVLFIEGVLSRRKSDDIIVTTPRIGIDYAGDWAEQPLRFNLRNHPCVSRC
jgi:DNA-3-methyladenine glycosylase